MANTRPTFRSFITSFTDFLTVAIHTILYERSIYPQTSFLSARKFNFAVRQSRHPKVCEWINDAVAAVEAELLKCTVARIAVVLYSKSNMPLERFMFDVSYFPVVPLAEIDTPMERKQPNDERSIMPNVDIEEQFRATMSKLTTCGSALKPLPKGCTFTLAIELKDEKEPPIGHPQPWMPVEPKLPSIDENGAQGTAVPLRAVRAGDMIFESWIVENKDRGEDG